ncbi:polymorphic toxin-type HINT domain-containing protein [Solwaraspora sp. WMMD792]|uniref:polymorphic toxin-type HINT domain-containing protein n=1 Tax=Solwaraspora sp. WMMD792 TaxID=3016099 RepID=UPI002417C343|nr:polymorphic toxin-type HINT domain-containing protein [Solwaraspora sp. WMMD792]MDG4769665.1 polymorphic toxin-type HINT domain-containing protein [Solwaraspora sp. WMMD792]
MSGRRVNRFWLSGVRRRVAGVTAVVVVASALAAPQAVAAPVGTAAEPDVGQRSVPVAEHVPAGVDDESSVADFAPVPPVWPQAASVVADLSSGSAAVDVGGLPVVLSAPEPVGDVLSGRVRADWADASEVPDRVRVEVVDPVEASAAGVALVVRVAVEGESVAGGGVRLELDYSGFAGAFGAAWASRLRLVGLSECALVETSDPECAGPVGLGSRNDPLVGRIGADVELSAGGAGAGRADAAVSGGGAVVGLLAAGDGETGSFKRTSLGQSASWQAGQSGGGFSWSYPLEVPPSPGGLEPEVSFGYSSSAVDGRTNGENSQPSWIGEGWDFHPGFIERSYRTCSDDLEGFPAHYTNATPDPCWREPNAKLVWRGQSTEIVLGDGDGKWRLANDDGSRIELLTGRHGYTHNGEAWRLTTTDGTQFYFGRQRLPGWNAGDRETNSVMGQGVFANHTWEPCYRSDGFYYSRCFMAYRWNLDYVVDVHGNSMSYWYDRELSRAGITGTGTYQVQYDRGSALRRVEYGTVAGGEADTVNPPMRVLFAVGDRCLSSCWNGSSPNTASWPDTPWDLQCDAAPCNNNIGPSYFTAKRLTSVTTQVRVGGVYQDVDRWDLSHGFPSTNESSALNPPSLWLSGIQRTGLAGGQVALPQVTFGGTRYANRTDHNVSAAVPVTNKYRITEINTESGGRIEITYEGSDCTVSSQADPDHNSKRCFPQYYKPDGSPAGWSWWNKYRVTQVVERDLVGGSPAVTHSYAYSTAGATSTVLWHHNDADVWSRSLPLRTWSDFRGWPTVTVTTGTGSGHQTQSRYLYFRGMHRDRTDAGPGTRWVTLTGTDGAVHGDDWWRAGFLYERIDYAAPGGQQLNRTIQQVAGYATSLREEDPVHAQPATWQSVISRVVTTIGYTWLEHDGTWRHTRTVDTWDTTYGTLISSDDRGDVSTLADDVCTRYTYARNTGAPWLIDTASRVETVATPCGSTPSYPDDLLSDTRFYRDGATSHSTAPTRGLVTKVETARSHDGTTPTYLTTGTTTYDAHGRPLTVTDALNRTTTTAYTPASGAPTTAVTATNPLGHDATTTLDPRRGLPTEVSDINDKVSTGVYDPLGRLTTVWAPGRPTTETPDLEYAYTITKTAPSHIRTRALGPNGNQIDSYDIYDGLLRPRQTQVTAPDGKRTISDTQYDVRGQTVKTSMFYNDASGPTGTLVTFADTAIESQTRTVYDGAGRPTRTQLWSANTLQWETVTGYDGDRVTLDPPTGGTPTTTLVDARGRQTALRQHTGSSPTGAYEETSYGYNPRDELTTVTDPAGNQWTYTYDLLGRRTGTVDPDAGTSTSTYDNADQLVTTTDGRGETLWYGYDNLGRRTELRDDTSTGALRASWTYDTLELGQLTSATRHHNGDAYTTAVTGYDDGYRPLGATVTIPAAETGLAGTYTTSHTYHDNGTPATTSLPAIGGLPAETLTYGYHTASGLPTTLTTGTDTFVSATSYHYDGSIAQRVLGTGGTRIRVSSPVETATRRLAASQVDTEHPTTPDTWDDAATTSYTYDPAGNVTSMAGTTAGVADQAECFTYDHLRRLTQAWTETTPTCTTPQRTGADPYRQAFTYDTTGNRLTATTWTATGSTTATSTYPTPGSPQPHAVTAVDHTGDTTRTDTYAYTTGGHTQTRTVDGVTQTLTWDAEGRLATTTEPGLDTTNIYDTSGNRLIRRDTTGTTLYLGHTELRRTTSNGQIDGTRHYQHAGATIAVRTVTGLTWLIPDHHGTNQISIDPTTHDLTRRRTLPFGDTRGTPPTAWPDDKGFVGGTQDPNSLTHIGARHYDPTLGRFISVDPIMDPADPQQMHGYAYANNNPTTYSDPTGLYITGDNDGHVRSYGKKNGKHVTKNYTPKSASPESYEKVTVVANQNYRVETNGFGQVFLNDYPIPSGGPDAAELVGYLAEHCQGDRWCHGEFHCGNYLSCDQMNTYLDANAVLYQICTKGYCSNDFWEKVADDNIILVGLVHGMFEGLGAVGGGGRRIKTGLPLHSDFRYYLSACKNSFASATLVLMADGSTKKIEQVEVGDMVLATDPETGRTAQKSVTDTITGDGDKSLVAVTIESDKGNPGAEGKTLIATDRHPFWLPKLDKWVDADDLEIGQWLRTSTGTYVQISAISRWVERRTVYNLTVADIHTYYVLADNTPVLVHNCPVAPGGRPGKDFTPAEKRAVWDENGNSYGVNVCERCGVEVSKPRKSERGVTPPTNEGQVDHIVPKSRGGSGDRSNGQLLCRLCNREKWDN